MNINDINQEFTEATKRLFTAKVRLVDNTFRLEIDLKLSPDDDPIAAEQFGVISENGEHTISTEMLPLVLAMYGEQLIAAAQEWQMNILARDMCIKLQEDIQSANN